MKDPIELDSVLDYDRNEARSAEHSLVTRFRHVAGGLYDEADLPSRSDLADEAGW